MDINVLLIEDDREDTIIIKKMLSKYNDPHYHITWIDNYTEAAKSLESDEFDICLVDYKLADGNGLHLIQQHTAKESSTPMILLTGFSSREIDDQAIAMGASDYIPKEELSASALDRSIRHAIERKNMEEKLLYLADHDVLTGLANRKLLQQYLHKSISRVQRQSTKLALFFIDLDRFKLVNDSLGHTMGDRLLVEAANRIQQSIRKEDVLARIGGDEFILLIDDLQNAEQASSAANKIIEVMSIPYVLEDNTLHLSASIGIAIGERDIESMDVLMKNADIALYKAKNNGRNQACFFNDDMNKKLQKNLEIEKGLHRALEQNELQLLFQPQIDLATYKMIGCEALIRWQQVGQGLISPAQFLPIAMDTGLIIPIGEWIIKKAIAQAKQWQFDTRNLKMCINIAPQQLTLDNLPDFIFEQLAINKFPPHLLELEITEDMLIENLSHCCHLLEKLRQNGVRIAIDDFGTGYSSLSYLKDLPFDVLKVDKSFTLSMLNNDKNLAITDAVINLAHKLNVNVIAEGVESVPQLNALADMQCDCVQGYLFNKPLSTSQMWDILDEAISCSQLDMPKYIICKDKASITGLSQ
ncbi:EAL domain-containing protein [Thalassotalea fusca]